MIEDMLPAIAHLSLAILAVAEIHVRMALVRDTADGAAVNRAVIDTGNSPDMSRRLPPAAFQQPDDIPGKENEKVADGGENQKGGVHPSEKYLVPVINPGQKGQPFNPYGNYEKEHDGKIGV